MKKTFLITSATVFSGFAAFGQGYLDFSFATHRVWDEFTTPGVGVNAATMDFAIYWGATTLTDQLPSVELRFGQSAGAPNQQVATNGVYSVPAAYGAINALLTGDGYTLASFGGSPLIGTIGASGNSLFGSTQITGTTGGDIYQTIVVA